MNATEASAIRCVGGIVHDADGRLLLIRRGHAPQAGHWTLPGGRVESDETNEQAVTRELAEETGLRVVVAAHVGTARIGPYEVYDYRCLPSEGTTLRAGDDAAEVAWVGAAEFAALHADDRLTDGLADTLARWRVLPR